MDQSHGWFSLVGNVLIHWAAAVSVISVIVHLRVFDRKSQMSSHLLAYMGAMAIVLVLSCIRIDAGGDTWWFALIRLITFIGVPLAMTQRLWLQLKAQRDDRGSSAPDSAEPTS